MPRKPKGERAVKNARAALAALLAAAALSLYALAGILRAGAEIERCSRTRQSLEEAAGALETENAALEELLNAGRDELIEKLARERLGFAYPGEEK